MAHKITVEVSDILRRSKCTASVLHLPEQLQPKMYQAVKKVLEISGFKWNRTSGCHDAVSGDAAATLAQALDDGSIVDPKKEWDLFETPVVVAEKMAAMCGLKRGMVVLEPSAGNGRLALAAAEYVGKEAVVCIEAQEKCCATLMNLGFRNAICCDFMGLGSQTIPKGLEVDVIIANFPFSDSQDIRHCRHAYDILQPGGRMVCITGLSWQFRTTKAHVEFRSWFEDLRGTTVMELPSGTFSESGTNVRSLLLTIDK